jgi:nicotinamide-nucleotide amidase
MNACIIIIGDEILSGRTLDINSNFIAKKLDLIGVSVTQILTISDNPTSINNILKEAFSSENDFIITTGGLGPTQDDKTKQTLAEFLSDKLILNQQALDFITQLYCNNGRVMNDLTRKQAMVPSSSEVIINRYGTAPILWTRKSNKILINLPGVPYETQAMFEEFIIPKIKEEFNLPYIVRRSVIVVDYPESELAIALMDWENNLSDYISLSYLPSGAKIELRLSAKGFNKEILEEEITDEIKKLSLILNKKIISSTTTNIVEIIADFLKKNQLTLSIAESVTGGNISHKITSLAGSSAYYKGGITAYSIETKKNILKIPESFINTHKVVSEEVVKEMATNCAKLFNSDIALSTTGVAGPGSDEFNDPVGLAYIGLYVKGRTYVKKYHYPYLTRNEMITWLTNRALEFIYFEIIENK